MIRVHESWLRLTWVLGLLLTSLSSTAPVAGAGEAFRPLTAAQVEHGRQRLVAAADQFERFLAYGTAENAAAWKRYLKWDELQGQLSAETQPDPRVLGEVLQQYGTGAPGLERPPFVNLREALVGYQRLVVAQSGEDAERTYQEQIAAIDRDVQAATASGGPLADLAARLELLEQLGQAPELIANVRQQFGRPNLLVSASARTLGSGFAESVSDVSPVDEMILKTHVRGTAHTVGTVSATLVPCDEMAVMELTLSGVSTSQTVGHQSPVWVYSQGVTQVLARKRLLIDPLGVRSQPATASCSTDNWIWRIQSERPFASNLIERVAWKRARQQEPLAERIASHRAERRIATRMDRQTLDRVASGNTRMEEKVRRPLRGRGIYPRWLRLWTTRERLRMVAVQGRENQLAAPAAPPEVAAHEVVAQVHESMLLNTAVNAIGGMTITDERAEELVKEATGEVPEELKVKQDEDPWAISFDLRQPVTVKFDQDQVVISIRGRRFRRGDQEVQQITQISATYQLGIHEGRARLTRVGDVEVIYPDKEGDRLSLVELRNKTFLTNKFEGLFKPELGGEGIQLSDRWEKLRDMSLVYVSAQNGWLTLGWN